MTRDELEKRNVGENLDAIMCLDPRSEEHTSELQSP